VLAAQPSRVITESPRAISGSGLGRQPQITSAATGLRKPGVGRRVTKGKCEAEAPEGVLNPVYRSFSGEAHSRGMQKKRSHPRTRTTSNAVITTHDRTIPCSVRDLSPGGARLTVRDTINLIPGEFELVMKSTRETYRAQVRWQRGLEIGVAFVQDRRGFGRRTSPPGSQRH
jgi:PilZ domain